MTSFMPRTRYVAWMIPAIVLSVGAIVFVSYRAVSEWQRNAIAVAERRAEATVNLLVTALVQDMRAVQVTVLSDQLPAITENTSVNRYDLIASAFARYPYPEVFFAWSRNESGDPVFYSRSDRYPSWLPAIETSNPFPVSLVTAHDIGRSLLQRISTDAQAKRRYSLFDTDLDRSPHQVVALLSYDDPFRRHLQSVFGFVVDLMWVRRHYFADLATQVTRMGGVGNGGLQVTIVDARDAPVVGLREARSADIAGRRQFPLLFFDPRLVAVDWPADLRRESWTAYARISDDPAVAAANVGAHRSLWVAALMATIVVVGLILTVHMAQASAQLAEIRSEFVSTVTHELKTPLATIQTISETFASGRGMTPELSRTYGRLEVHEVKRLRRLIENLLAYSRVADVADIYSFERVEVNGLVEHTLREFASQLEYGQFEVCVDVPDPLPPIRADRKGMSFAIGNLIENAIRYSPEQRYLAVRARTGGRGVLLEITDRGIGIPDDDLPLVTRKFFTGHRGDRSGSGLGLAIVERIVSDHGGSLSIASRLGSGTTVTLDLPIAEAA